MGGASGAGRVKREEVERRMVSVRVMAMRFL
jgi:hypothetical protein